MANTILTINMITREAIRLWKNTNAFLKNVDMQYDDQFAKTGGKIGESLRIRLPNQFVTRTGPAASVQDTAEQSTTLVLATQKGVDVSFNTQQRAMQLDDYSKRILQPMVAYLAADVAYDLMTGVEGGVSNYVANVDGAGNVDTPTSQTFLDAGAKLDELSAPTARQWCAILDPVTMAKTVGSLTGLFNPQRQISEQYKSGMMTKDSLRLDWYSDQTVIKHTTATYTVISGTNTAATVSGANQTGNTLTTSAITGGLALGDIITVEDVNSVNRLTRQSDGTRAQFVVTAAVASGGTSIPIYPSLIPPSGGNAVQYQTVNQSPPNGSDVDVVTLPGEVYRKNIVFAPEAITMATADLEIPRGIHEGHRESTDGISMRMITAYNVQTDQMITRMDILYGYLYVKPEWAVAVANKVT